MGDGVPACDALLDEMLARERGGVAIELGVPDALVVAVGLGGCEAAPDTVPLGLADPEPLLLLLPLAVPASVPVAVEDTDALGESRCEVDCEREPLGLGVPAPDGVLLRVPAALGVAVQLALRVALRLGDGVAAPEGVAGALGLELAP